MKVKEFLEYSGLSVDGFARAVGISAQSLYRYMEGHKPHLKTAQRISEATSGYIEIKDLIPNYKDHSEHE